MPVQKVLILGGGSAGWIVAAHLARHRPDLGITVLESTDIPTVSVGESMNPISRLWNDALGLDERAFMRSCDASYKIGIKFDGFRARGESFFHPFGYPRRPARFRPNADAEYASAHLCRSGRLDLGLAERHSYHVDAGLYGVFLRRFAMDRGVQQTIETVRDVSLAGDGSIAAVGGHRADLFVDCTGFRSLLLGGALAEPFQSIGEHLVNDRALAMNVPYLDKAAELHPFTSCTALSAGWVWDIPLWSRRGVGYVYSSRYLGDDEAERELREHLGRARVESLPLRKITIRHGRHARPWVKNCVAIGLAAGFIEPLESTGISLTQLDVSDLGRLLEDPDRYNERVTARFDATVDFIQAHYVLTSREDTPYWRDQKRATPWRSGLEDVARDARQQSYGAVEKNRDAFYRPSNWNCILSGMGHFGPPAEEKPALPLDLERLPSHHDYLEKMIYPPEG